MTTETIITNRIKYFQTDYPDGVPINILKLDLDLSVDELQKNLLSLEEQGFLFIENEEYVKLVENSPAETVEESTSESIGESNAGCIEKFTQESSAKNMGKSPVKDSPRLKVPDEPAIENEMMYDLDDREIKALEIIKDLTEDSGHISRYILEGTLLYGELKLSTLGVYNLIMSLENKGIIRKIQILDSEYYAL